MKEGTDPSDLQAFDISGLPWDDVAAAAESIIQIYATVRGKASEAIGWYMEKRKRRKRAAQLLRASAVLFAAAGGLVPIIALVWPETVPSDLGYALIAVAAACLFTNRYLGISSGWIRYIRTAFSLERALEAFQLEWAEALARMGGRPSKEAEVDVLLKKLWDFTATINQLVEDETNAWALQFEEDLTQLERIIAPRGPVPRPPTEPRKRGGRATGG